MPFDEYREPIIIRRKFPLALPYRECPTHSRPLRMDGRKRHPGSCPRNGARTVIGSIGWTSVRVNKGWGRFRFGDVRRERQSPALYS
jgi:hypothetical protein